MSNDIGQHSDDRSSIDREKTSLEIDKLREEIRALKRPSYALPGFWFGAVTTILAVLGVIAQGVLSSIKSERADLKVEQAERDVERAAKELAAAKTDLEKAVRDRESTHKELTDLQARRDTVSKELGLASKELELVLQRRDIVIKSVGSAAKFDITLRFLGAIDPALQAVYKDVAARWERVIVGDLGDVEIDGATVDDIVIEISAPDIDGEGGILGQAGPTHLRPESDRHALLPAKGRVQMDKADVAAMEKAGTLKDVLLHEMGHTLGMGTIWSQKALLKGVSTANPVFVGRSAQREYAALLGSAAPRPVPVENMGGTGTRATGWRETVFLKEAMTEFISGGGNVISRITIGALEDMGYVVNYDAADDYKLGEKAGTNR